MVLDYLFSMKADWTWQHLQLQLVHELEHVVLSTSGKMDQLGVVHVSYEERDDAAKLLEVVQTS